MRSLNRTLGPIPAFDTRTRLEVRNLLASMNRPFSGYLGGIHKGGYWVERLAEEWRMAFGVNHAMPCNSATSGLLAACMAVGIEQGDEVWCPVYTMSATAACATVLGASVKFVDVEDVRFSINMNNFAGKPKAIIVTNLFGHPAYLSTLRSWCDTNKVWMIEDNAQSPFAKEGSAYAGTVGHIGVFSLNVHKHIQSGEGGVVVTDSGGLALQLKDAINHGELRPGGAVGLNLRMAEQTAAIACAQLSRAPMVIRGRRELAQEMTQMVRGIPGVLAPQEAPGCEHVYYIWAAKIYEHKRHEFVETLVAHGIPMNLGYSPLLNRVFRSGGDVFPMAQLLEDVELITFDICSHDPSAKQRKIMWEIFDLAGHAIQ